MNNRTKEQLLEENQALRARLEEAEEALRAIRNGEVDALVIYGSAGEQIYTLQGADHTYRVMVESISEGAASALADGTLLYCNRRLAEMLGVPLESLPGSSLARFVALEDMHVFESLLEQGRVKNTRAEIYLKNQSGLSLPVLLSASPVEMEHGWGLCLIATDLTPQKRNEAILASERLARSILEQAGQAIVVCDPDGIVIRASQVACEMIQKNPLLQPFEQAFPLVWSEGENQNDGFTIQSVLHGRSVQGIEASLALPASHPAHLLVSAAPLRNEHEDMLGCIVTLSDITARKQAEVALQTSERTLKLFVDYAPASIAMFDPEMKYIAASQRWRTDYRLGEQNIIGQSHYAIFPEISEQWKEIHRRCLAGAVEKCEEDPFPRADGSMDWVRWEIHPWYNDAGEIGGIIMFTEVITERKKFEQALRESEERFRTVWEISTDAMALSTPDASVIAANPAYCKLYGYALEQVQGHNFAIIFPPEARELANEQYQVVFNSPEIPPGFESVVQCSDGTRRIVESKIQFIRQDGQRQAMLSIIRDITENKRAEEERERLLAENRRQKELLVAQSNIDPGGQALVSGLDLVFQYANPAYRALTPHPEADPLGLPYHQVWQSFEDYAQQAVVQQVLTSGVEAHIQHHEHRFPDGTTRYYSFHLHPLEWDGEPAAYLVLWDTTELVRAQTALRESQERLLLTTEAAELGFWSFNLTNQDVVFDEICRALFKLPADGQISYPDLFQVIHPEDRQPTDDAVQYALQNHIPYDHEFRVLKPDGGEHWIHSRGKGIYNSQGEPIRMVGVAFDSTRLKQAELEIQSQNAQIEAQHLLIDQIEQERQRISRDLHDGPLQELISITFDLQNAISDARDSSEEQVLQTIQKSMKTQIDNLRTFASDLRPPILNKFGLERAIRSYLEKFGKKHPKIRTNFDALQTGPILAEPIRVSLYRILQEAMNNIVRHAEASEISIRLEKDNKKVDLTIEDNGHGFIVPANLIGLVHTGHFGLVGIQERVDSIHGQLQIVSKPGQGTWMRISVPIESLE